MLFVEKTFHGLKELAEKIIPFLEKKEKIATLSREQIEEVIGLFPKTEEVLRNDIRKRFAQALDREIPENISWFELENLFERYFSGKNGWGGSEKEAYRKLSRDLDYPLPLLKKVMSCVGKGQVFQNRQATAKV
jgi:hypothetical protein